MKKLLIPALISAAAFASANAVLADASSSSLSASVASSNDAGGVIRVVRVSTSTAGKDATCDTATWPNIPAACLQREGTTKATSVSLNN
jgi:hypothetical protein